MQCLYFETLAVRTAFARSSIIDRSCNLSISKADLLHPLPLRQLHAILNHPHRKYIALRVVRELQSRLNDALRVRIRNAGLELALGRRLVVVVADLRIRVVIADMRVPEHSGGGLVFVEGRDGVVVLRSGPVVAGVPFEGDAAGGRFAADLVVLYAFGRVRLLKNSTSTGKDGDVAYQALRRLLADVEV